MSEILLPFIVSTSGYNSPEVDWSAPISPPVAAVLCRASLGTPEWMGSARAATDQSFPRYWPQWDHIRLPRAAYPFFYNGLGGADQARWFVQCVMAAGGFHPCDRIVLDAEIATGLSLKEMLDFFTSITALVPHVPVDNYLIYSRAELLNPLKVTGLTDAQRTYLRRLRQWPAGYPDEIAGWDFARLKSVYQPDSTKYGQTVIIQYAASAVVSGISKPGYMSVECNVPDLEYLAKWQKDTADFYGTVVIPTDVVTTPLDGVKVTRGRRFDTDVQVIEVSKASIQETVVTPPGPCKLIETIPGDIASNGGDFDMQDCTAVGLLVSRGTFFSPQADAEPALGFKSDNTPQIDHWTIAWPNAVGLKRYLVINGAVNPVTSDAWTVREPRTIYGVKSNGDLIILSAKGRQADQAGLDLFQAASIMIEFGAWTAGDGDGGSSTQARVAGELFVGTTDRRPVADFVSIVIKSGGGSMAKYKCTVIWSSGASIRPEPSTSNSGVGVYPLDAIFYASELVPDMDSPADTSKQWAKIESDPVHGTQFAGKYVAVKYPASSGAVDRCRVEDVTAPPPPSGASIDHIEVVYTDGTRQTFIPQA